MFDRLIIIGVGLLGGSVGLAAKKSRIAKEIVGVDENAEKAIALGCIDASTTIESCSGELAIICCPVGKIASIAKQIANDKILISDVGSTKEQICRELSEIRFIGGHPIAGSEKNGCENASESLFTGKKVVLTPLPNANPQDLALLSDFWSALGANVSLLNPSEHDSILARTSHLQHVISSILAASIEKSDVPYCGSGFESMTRLAKGDASLWSDIFLSNRKNLIAELDALKQKIESLQLCLQENDIAALQNILKRQVI